MITIPRAMHPELTRRQMEEHPPEGPDPDNPLERQGRVHFGMADMHDALAAAHRFAGRLTIEAARRSERDLKAVHIPEGLLGWVTRITHDLARVAHHGLREPDKE
jgi:hypothetical protein